MIFIALPITPDNVLMELYQQEQLKQQQIATTTATNNINTSSDMEI